jgi:hypothetical protein
MSTFKSAELCDIGQYITDARNRNLMVTRHLTFARDWGLAT